MSNDDWAKIGARVTIWVVIVLMLMVLVICGAGTYAFVDNILESTI